MARYILIDEHTGYIWGDVEAEGPFEACEKLDNENHAFDYDYEEVARFNGETGYHVYEAPAGFPEVTDGQDEAQIAAVEAIGSPTLIAHRDKAEEWENDDEDSDDDADEDEE